MIKKLIAISNALDEKGAVKEANYLDSIIKKAYDELGDYNSELYEIELGFDDPAKIKRAKDLTKIALDHPLYEGMDLSEVGEDEDAFDPNEGRLYITADRNMETDHYEHLKEIVTFLQIFFPEDQGIRLADLYN